MPARLLMIALDGADSGLLRRWSDDGLMLNLAALRARGVTLPMTAPREITDDSLWASFQYGADVADHGRYFDRGTSVTGDICSLVEADRDRDAFWHWLGAKGVRSAIIDVPKVTPPKPFNGIHLADWLVHGRYFEGPRSFPEDLAADVQARFGRPQKSSCGYYQWVLRDKRVRQITANLRASVGQKRAASLHYLASEPWDLFIAGFKEAHCACHGFWHFVDRNHPDYDELRCRRLDQPMQRVFEAIDAALGDLVQAAGPGADIVVFSTTGMQPNGSIDHLMPQIVGRLNTVLGGRQITVASQALERLRRSPPSPGPLALLPYTDNQGALRLTALAPTEPTARAAMAREIEELLSELTDAESGLPVVATCTYPATERSGARAASLPDIVVHYRSGVVPRTVWSPRLGRVDASRTRRRPGNHVGGGLLIAAGPNVPSAAPGVASLAHFASFAARVLGVSEAADEPDRQSQFDRHRLSARAEDDAPVG